MFYIICILVSFTIHPPKLTSTNQIFRVKTRYYLKTVIPSLDTTPAESSVVYIGYTPKELVIYAKNYQSGVHASSRRRDSEGVVRESEDCFYIYLATHGIGKGAYFIGVNPLGAIADRVVSPSGITEWDGDIKAKAHITGYGWDALLIIPFNTISYNHTVWGLDFLRVVTGKNMRVQVLVPRKNLGDHIHISKMKLDFSYIKKSGEFNVFLIPTLRYTIDNESKKIEGGITARWRKGQATLLEATAYPDYSELETDVQEFDLSLLPVDYPEKRPFFIEGRSFYTSPVSLIRTRNINLPKFGAKFYSTTENSIFTIYVLETDFVTDTGYYFLEFYRYAYNFSKTMRAGTFGLFCKSGYNLASLDFSSFLRGIKINAEAARVIIGGSNFVNVSISRNVTQGLYGFLSMKDMDSSFISPINYIQFNFDGIRALYGQIGYTRYFKNWTLGAKFYGKNVINKYTKERIMQFVEPMIFFGPYPYIFAIQFDINKLDYMKYWNPKIKTFDEKMVNVNLLYNGSTWKNFSLSYSTGDYAGKKAHYYGVSIMYNFLGHINIGTNDYRVIIPSAGQNFLVFQLFGEISITNNLFLKPYVSVTGNCKSDKVICLTKDRVINTNLIIAYEPRYLSGVYLALNRTESGGVVTRKHVFKLQLGYKISF